MSNKELQELLQKYPDDMQMLIMVSHRTQTVYGLHSDHILHTSETAFVNDDAPEGEWDHEDGKVELGNGKQYLLFNPIIL